MFYSSSQSWSAGTITSSSTTCIGKPELGLSTLEEMEAAHLLDILKRCKRKIGAAGWCNRNIGFNPQVP